MDMAEVKSRGILFGPDMVRANRDGRKTQTRRVIKRVATKGPVTEFGETSTKGYDFHFRDRQMRWHDVREPWLLERCPYGPVGRLLYVRETWARARVGLACHAYKSTPAGQEIIIYRADWPTGEGLDSGIRWKSSIHLHKKNSRDWLRVTGIRAERVQDISEADAQAEGVTPEESIASDRYWPTCKDAFRKLWNAIHGPSAWERSDWVWVIAYERTEAPA